MRLLRGSHLMDETVVALLDGELTLPERVDAERHLHGCPRCTDQMERHGRALRALAAALALDALQAEVTTNPAPHWHLRPGVGAAGAGVLAGAVGALMVAGMLARRGSRRTAI